MKNWLAPLILAAVVTLAAAGALWAVHHLSGWPVYAASVSLLLTVFLSVWKGRVETLVQRKMTREAPDLLTKLTSQLPVLVYQFRTYPTGHSSVTFASEAIRRIYEVGPEEARQDGCTFLKLLHPEDKSRIEASLRHSFVTLEPWSGEFRVILPKAGLQWRFAQALVERLPDGGTIWHGFVADITEKKQAEESARYADRMRLARDRAEDAGRAKNAFLAMMSHEIRTPMHAVMGHLDLLLTSGLEKTVREHVESAQAGARSMLALLDDLLAIARIDQEDLHIEEKEFEITEWVRGVTGLFRCQVEAKGLEWRLSLAEDLPRVIYSDRIRLSQCLFALLENAVKFTETGYVELRVSLQETMLSQRLRLEVRDSGPGIPPQDLEKIFEPFTRVDESPSRPHGGLGVGLAICHHLTTRLRGTLTATSQPGEGSTFVLEFPLQPAVPLAFPQVPPPTREYPRLDLHVLIVEDQKTNQKLLGMMLKKIGCTYEFADNGRQGVDKFQEKAFDAIFMDLQMPEMDGIAATRAIRDMEQAKAVPLPVPIIAVTANTLPTDRAECLAVGMNDFLGKPVRVQELASSLLALGKQRTSLE